MLAELGRRERIAEAFLICRRSGNLGYKDVEFYIWANGLFLRKAPCLASIMTRLREAMRAGR